MMQKDSRKDYMLEQILDNNYNLYMLIKKQVKVLEEYSKESIGEIHKQNYINEYEEMLDLIELTTASIDEWDDEADRKS